MENAKIEWKTLISKALESLAKKRALSAETTSAIVSVPLVAESPPKPEMGDIGFPMFPYAKLFHTAPNVLAKTLIDEIESAAEGEKMPNGSVTADGPYINVHYDRAAVIRATITAALGAEWGKSSANSGKKVMIEFSCPNTNKPLHLGHLRNNVLGESLSRIMKATGATVRKVNLINDRGIHICKSMLAYSIYGGGRSPEDEGLKSDHFVGKYYVLFNTLKAEDPKAEEKAQDLLRRWEAGEPDVIELWRRMNSWAIDGIKKTYERQGVDFDQYYFESQTYMKGKEEVIEGLGRGIFFKEADGSVWVNLEDIGLDRKVLLRKDGTSLYITQDIGTAIFRHKDWPFDELIYIVANEQQYHFKVLFEVLKRLGYEWASNLHHLAYGLVNLPSGRMKTREGTVVDADDLIDELQAMARKEIEGKGRDASVGDIEEVSLNVTLGAIHYYLLQTSPMKDMLYDPEQSLSFTGDTGPYVQYMGARVCSILRKYEQNEGNAHSGVARPELLANDADWAIVRRLTTLRDSMELSARNLEPSAVVSYAHQLAADFSSWYRENPVLNSPDPDLSASRVELVKAVRSTLVIVCNLLCIPFLETM
jgi:arginyl-tRNA synthetase